MAEKNITLPEYQFKKFLSQLFGLSESEAGEKDANEITIEGESMICWFAKRHHNEILTFLVYAGFDVDQGGPIFEAMKAGNLEGVKILRSAGAKSFCSDESGIGTSLVEESISSRDIKCVRFALEDLKRYDLPDIEESFVHWLSLAALSLSSSIYKAVKGAAPKGIYVPYEKILRGLYQRSNRSNKGEAEACLNSFEKYFKEYLKDRSGTLPFIDSILHQSIGDGKADLVIDILKFDRLWAFIDIPYLEKALRGSRKIRGEKRKIIAQYLKDYSKAQSDTEN